LLIEKLPLLGLAAVFSVVAVQAQDQTGALPTLKSMPLAVRLKNVAVTYVIYLVRALQPTDLAPFYPHPRNDLSLGWALGALAVLLVITGVVFLRVRTAPYLAIGWLWFVGSLVPVCGLVQVGSHARADRYVYMPMVGLFIAGAWGLRDFAQRWRMPRLGSYVSGPVLLYLSVLSWTQAHYWHDSLTLWNHALDVTEKNYIAHMKRGYYLRDHGDLEAAEADLREALRLLPHDAQLNSDLGLILAQRGKLAEAEAWFRIAVALSPGDAEANNNLGVALLNQGKAEQAEPWLRAAVALRPTYPEARNNLGVALRKQGKPEEAAQEFREALRLRPDWPPAKENLRKTRSAPPRDER
jgi:Tfp pilus assembly protein PilF